jgi:hypothetical protein
VTTTGRENFSLPFHRTCPQNSRQNETIGWVSEQEISRRGRISQNIGLISLDPQKDRLKEAMVCIIACTIPPT